MMAVTPSKQWIHFFRSERWPPTSNILQQGGSMAMGSSSLPHHPHPAPCLSFPGCPEQELCWEKAPGRAEHGTSTPGILPVPRICPGTCHPSQGQGSVWAQIPARANPRHEPGRMRPPFPGVVSTVLPRAGLQEMLSETRSGEGTAGFCQRPWTEGSHRCSAERLWAQQDCRQHEDSRDDPGAPRASPAAGGRGCPASTKSPAAAPHPPPTTRPAGWLPR